MRRSGGSLGQIPKPGHLQARGFCVHPGSLTHQPTRRHSRAAGHFGVASPRAASECFFSFFGGVRKRVISYLEELARRTYFGTDGTEAHRAGFVGSLIEGLEGLLGFFGLVILPAMAAATICHWIFD